MVQPVYLIPRVHSRPWLAKILLGIIMLSGVFQFGAFALSQGFVISYLGAQPEDVTFALQCAYAGILVMLPVQFRFQRYFETRNYLIAILAAGILLAIGCVLVQDLILFYVIRFFQGIAVCGIAACMMVQATAYMRSEYRQAGGTALLFGTVLSNSVAIGWVASNVVLNANFQQLYYYIIFFLVISLIIVMLIFRSSSGKRPYPLWQIDWIGIVFFIPAAIALAYLIIYGNRYYWFNDPRIRKAAIIFVLSLLLYTVRLLSAKRPLIDLRVLKQPGVWLGLLTLALYYGMKESLNLVLGFTGNTLQWSPERTMELGAFNVLGIVPLMFLSVRLLAKRPKLLPAMVASGFGLLMIYHLWVYLILTPDLAFADLIIPAFLQGAASGIMFVPIVAFIVKNAGPEAATSGVVLGAYTRFAALLNASAGLFDLQQRYGQVFRESFLSHLTATDLQTAERLNMFRQLYLSKGYAPDAAAALANSALARALAGQTQLLTIRAIFVCFAVLSAVAAAVIVILISISFVKSYLAGRSKASDISSLHLRSSDN